MLMIDIEGKTLTPEDKQLLKDPRVGGIILFTRNYENPEQLIHLTTEIHALRSPPLMIAVDHEGGRVQRFREGFTQLPPMRELGELYDHNPQAALKKSEELGFIMGSELRAVGINCSFAPILDIDAGISHVIGNRSFHSDPEIITKLAGALITGMKKAGLITVGKHFPGHGHVEADSHVAIPVDHRPLNEIQQHDILPFQSLINMGLDGIMPAHVIYDKIDKNPAGFSTVWLQHILRQQLGFRGIIFSDDLSMEGASPMGNMVQRVEKAKAAGCDMILICNNRPAALEVIQHVHT